MQRPHEKHHEDWHPADIKAALEKKGYTFARLAREMGYRCHNVPNQVLVRPYPKVERAVARVLGLPPEDIWPSRYRGRTGRAA